MTDEIENLRAENAKQQALIVELQTLVADLQRELQQLKNRSSKNSSQPPSLDFKEKKKPGSKDGGVKRHEAHRISHQSCCADFTKTKTIGFRFSFRCALFESTEPRLS